jgi:hypothetical protein
MMFGLVGDASGAPSGGRRTEPQAAIRSHLRCSRHRAFWKRTEQAAVEARQSMVRIQLPDCVRSYKKENWKPRSNRGEI